MTHSKFTAKVQQKYVQKHKETVVLLSQAFISDLSSRLGGSISMAIR